MCKGPVAGGTEGGRRGWCGECWGAREVWDGLRKLSSTPVIPGQMSTHHLSTLSPHLTVTEGRGRACSVCQRLGDIMGPHQ